MCVIVLLDCHVSPFNTDTNIKRFKHHLPDETRRTFLKIYQVVMEFDGRARVLSRAIREEGKRGGGGGKYGKGQL